jgi:hypothetical protein
MERSYSLNGARFTLIAREPRRYVAMRSVLNTSFHLDDSCAHGLQDAVMDIGNGRRLDAVNRHID